MVFFCFYFYCISLDDIIDFFSSLLVLFVLQYSFDDISDLSLLNYLEFFIRCFVV